MLMVVWVRVIASEKFNRPFLKNEIICIAEGVLISPKKGAFIYYYKKK
jgi:hypothetical protein